MEGLLLLPKMWDRNKNPLLDMSNCMRHADLQDVEKPLRKYGRVCRAQLCVWACQEVFSKIYLESTAWESIGLSKGFMDDSLCSYAA